MHFITITESKPIMCRRYLPEESVGALENKDAQRENPLDQDITLDPELETNEGELEMPL